MPGIADKPGPDLGATLGVLDGKRRAGGNRPVPVAPLHQRDESGLERAAGLGQPVLVPGARAGIAVFTPDEHTGGDQRVQPVGQHRPRSAGRCPDRVEPAHAEEHLAQHEQRPPFTDDLEAAGHRADTRAVHERSMTAGFVNRTQPGSVRDVTAETVWGVPRKKTITWYDPLTAAEQGGAMPGIDHLRAIRDGLLPPPPIAAHFDLQVVSVEPGDVTFTCVPDESAYNPIGMVHGGLVCTLLDSVTGCAVQSTLPAGVGYTSIEIKVNYLRPVHAHSGELRARGRIVKPGRRAAFAEGEVRGPDGKLVATGSSTCLVVDR
jgi:uncharacterized protein (TIGR00369 family)